MLVCAFACVCVCGGVCFSLGAEVFCPEPSVCTPFSMHSCTSHFMWAKHACMQVGMHIHVAISIKSSDVSACVRIRIRLGTFLK